MNSSTTWRAAAAGVASHTIYAVARNNHNPPNSGLMPYWRSTEALDKNRGQTLVSCLLLAFGCAIGRRRARHMGYPFTGWRPPVPSGPLYSRKRTSHAPRPCELGQCIENDRGWKPFPQISRQAWIEPPQNRDHDGRGLCAGGTFAGIKRTEGSHPAKVSPARGPIATDLQPTTAGPSRKTKRYTSSGNAPLCKALSSRRRCIPLARRSTW